MSLFMSGDELVGFNLVVAAQEVAIKYVLQIRRKCRPWGDGEWE